MDIRDHCPTATMLKSNDLVYRLPKESGARVFEVDTTVLGGFLRHSLPINVFSEEAKCEADLDLAYRLVAHQVEADVVGSIVSACKDDEAASNKIDQLVRWMIHRAQFCRYYGPWAVLRKYWTPTEESALSAVEGIKHCVATKALVDRRDVYVVQLTPDVVRLVLGKYFALEKFTVETAIVTQVRHDFHGNTGIVKGTLRD